MELRAVVLAGALAGFTASALNSILWQPLWMAVSKNSTHSESPHWRSPSVSLHLASVLLHLVAGSILGLLFWLSWGLTGIVSIPWWVRGLSFAGLTWIALCVPLLLSLVVSARISSALLAKSAMEWLTTCVLVGLACAWSWAEGK
jgi:uncharacterized membrane protein YedE/YeeE